MGAHGGRKRVPGSLGAGGTHGCALPDVGVEETNLGPPKELQEPLAAEPSLQAFLPGFPKLHFPLL